MSNNIICKCIMAAEFENADTCSWVIVVRYQKYSEHVIFSL